MSERAWYRSFYWRIAIGFIACVAALLVVQSLLFFWLADRDGGAFGVRSPQHLAAVVASDLSSALESDPALDIHAYVREHFSRAPQRIVVTMADGRTFRNRTFDAPNWPPRAGRRGRSRLFPSSPIVVDDRTLGEVIVLGTRPPTPSLVTSLVEYGPTLALTGVVLLVVGTTLMAFFVFRPVRSRLRELQRAAEAIGGGQTSVRANESGGDEVADLAAAFNRMAADLDARARELAHSDRVRRQLLADVSHELMTPLTAIRGYLETLSMPEAVRDPEARDRYLRIVAEEGQRLEAIAGDLLDLARLEGGGTTLDLQPVAVATLFDRAGARQGTVLAEKRVTRAVAIGAGADQVQADERRLEQVIQNLVANAVRHTPAGGRIELSADRVDGGRIRLRVRDSGPGIPLEHLPRVFDRFYRVEAARDHATGGSGLGLSIVRAIVHAHGGTVSAANAPTGGAQFDVLLDTPDPTENASTPSAQRV